MSLQRVTLIIAAKHMTEQSNLNTKNDYNNKPPPVPLHGVNVVLGGAMMSGIITMVFIICYCCHRNQMKRQNNIRRYLRDPGLSMEIYTVEGQQFFEISEDVQEPVPSGPPPSYESVVNGCRDKSCNNVHICHDSELPSYEAAVVLAHNEGRIL